MLSDQTHRVKPFIRIPSPPFSCAVNKGDSDWQHSSTEKHLLTCVFHHLAAAQSDGAAGQTRPLFHVSCYHRPMLIVVLQGGLILQTDIYIHCSCMMYPFETDRQVFSTPRLLVYSLQSTRLDISPAGRAPVYAMPASPIYMPVARLI